MSGNVIELSKGTFENEVISNSGAVLVDFWASWCAPCRAVAPVVEKIAEDTRGRLKVCKVNIDDDQEVASRLGIMSIPTLVLFKGGKEQERIVGALGQGELMRRIEKHLE